MLRNYFKVAIRSLIRNKFYTTVNVIGLAVGMACVFLIIQYLKHELGYDRFHAGADNIYRVAWEDANPQTRTPHPMAQALVNDFPEVESAVSLTPMWGFGLTRETFSIGNPEKDIRFDERNVIAVDTTFFDVFTFPLLKGNPETALKIPGGLLISESMAKKYFGDEDPMGKHLTVNNDRQLVEVVGVFRDVPTDSHFHFDFLGSYVTEKANEDEGSSYYTWGDFGHYNYIRLKPGSDSKELEGKLTSWARRYIDVSDETYRAFMARNFGFRLQPLTDIHLNSHLRWELENNGYMAYIYIMSAAAFLILVIAGVNFINLTTAQSSERIREIGIRKSLGAFRRQIAFQFTGESLVISLLAMALAAGLIEFAMPFFYQLTGRPIELGLFDILALGAMGIITGVLAGAFPSAYLSGARPDLILKGQLMQSPAGLDIRKGFTVFQFFASMILITSSIIIYNQLNFIQDKALGFNQEEVIVIPVKNYGAINPRLEEIRTELKKIPGVVDVSATSNIPGRSFNQNPVFASQAPDMRIASSEAMVDYDFFKVLNIDIIEGRGFSRENPADRDAFILNETAAKKLYKESAVGKEFSWDYDAGMVKGPVIGIVKDFNFQSLHQPVRPLLFVLRAQFNYVIVKMNTGDFPTSISAVEKTWKKFDDRFNFEFSFLSDELTAQYKEEKNMAIVMGSFSAIAVVIACFGLLGIASISFRQRTKEVTIRKVLGASRSGIVIMLLKDFTMLVLIALVLAVPLVWWLMGKWLQNFSFRTTLDPVIFVASGLALLMVAWCTLSYLTLKISATNPAETLKNA